MNTCQNEKCFITRVSQISFACGPFWLRKITEDPDVLDHINILCPYDRYPKLKTLVYISELLLGNYK
jgi:hypothetical protein